MTSPTSSRTLLSRALPNGTLHLDALNERAIRVRFQASPDGMRQSNILLPDVGSTEPVLSSSDRLVLAGISAEICGGDRLVFRDADGQVLLAEAADGRRLSEGRLGDEHVYVAEQLFELPDDERLYGTGCFQDGALDLRGWPRRLTQVNSQISLPFVLSSKGYGLLWHNRGMSELNMPKSIATLRQRSTGSSQVENVTTTSGNAEVTRRFATFEGEVRIDVPGRHAFMLDIGRKMGSRYRVEIDGRVCVDFTNLWLPPTMSFFAELDVGVHRILVEANDTDAPSLYFGPVESTTSWRSPVADAIDYVIIAGPSAGAIMQTYRDLLGPTPILPRWAYGYVHCRERFHSTEEIIETLDEFRRRRLPVDVMVQDWQYWGKHGWNAMRFDEDHYPDPALLVDELHRRDARFMLSVWSRVGRETELGKEIERRGYYIPDTEWVDFFNPEAVDFYCRTQEDQLGKYGVDAWWQDATEPENDDLDGRMTAAGRGEHVRLTYPLQVARSVYEARRALSPDLRVAILTRCAFLGQQRYGAVTWSGDVGHDWETLRRQIPAGLNMAAAGYAYWTVDAGGFFRPGDGQYTDPGYRERFLRWFQYATFLPMQRVHGYQTNTEFWRYGTQVEDIARRYLELRYRLLPYLYGLASETWRTGMPISRPMIFDFPHDHRALDERHTFMFGGALHVAPVTDPGVATWPVYLPSTPGGWYDLWTGEHRDGGRVHSVDAPIERIPLHARAGTILPMGPVLQSTVHFTGEHLDLYVYPGCDGEFELYEDQGLDNSYEQGAYSTIRFRWDDRRKLLEIGARSGTFDGMLTHRTFLVRKVTPGVGLESSGDGHFIEYSGSPLVIAE